MSIKSPKIAPPVFFIRCDSSTVIGSGHVMRCLNIAHQLRLNGAEVHFLCRELAGNISERIEQAGFMFGQVKIADRDSDFSVSQMLDAKETLGHVRAYPMQKNAAVVIVDHYGIKKEWQREIRKHYSLVVIDDLADRPHFCDILLNQNYYKEGPSLYNSLVNKDAKILSGPEYALISNNYGEHRPAHPATNDKVRRIVIFFGASDFATMTLKSLQAVMLLEEKIERIDVVIGKNQPDRDALEKLSHENANVYLHDYINDFAQFLTGADLMIGAGGVTQLERCCLGIPGIVIAIAENQIQIAKNLYDLNSVDYLGWYNEVTTHRIHSALQSLVSDKIRRQVMAEVSHRLVDGKGLERVVEMLLRPRIQLRYATLDDSEDLYQWRNNIEVRKNSYNAAEISRNEHSMWLEKSLDNPERALLIAHMDKESFGVLRFDYKEEVATVSVYLAPHFIGQGLGAELLKTGSLWLKKNKPTVRFIRALIKEDNVRSIKVFMDAGYVSKENYFELSIASED